MAETKVVLQQRLKLEGSVMKVTESFGFLGLPIQPLYLSKLAYLIMAKKSKVDAGKGFSFSSRREKLARRRTVLQQSNSIQAYV